MSFFENPQGLFENACKKVTSKHNAANPDIFMQNTAAYFFTEIY